MRLLSYERDGAPRLAAQIGCRHVDLADASGRLGLEALPARFEDFIKRPAYLKIAQEVTSRVAQEDGTGLSQSIHGIRFLPPIVSPPKIVCVARNYAEHAKEAGLAVSETPILFARFPATLIGDQAPILLPEISHQLDWEGEFAVVIGKHTNGRRITKAEAMEYVFGYTVFNDVTVRDYQFKVTQYTAGKNFRASGPIGPVVVTTDELADPHNLQIVTRINGRVEQDANTRTMLFDIPTILENIAEFIDLEPGDIIPMGTPAGVGFKRKPPVFLKPGDVVSVEVEGIGILTNPVQQEVRK